MRKAAFTIEIDGMEFSGFERFDGIIVDDIIDLGARDEATLTFTLEKTWTAAAVRARRRIKAAFGVQF